MTFDVGGDFFRMTKALQALESEGAEMNLMSLVTPLR